MKAAVLLLSRVGWAWAWIGLAAVLGGSLVVSWRGFLVGMSEGDAFTAIVCGFALFGCVGVGCVAASRALDAREG